jgi:phosphopantetheine adenylyltransferase
MTRTELVALSARAARIERIIRAIRMIYRSYYEIELREAEAELKAALDSVPKIPLTAPNAGA